MVAATEETNNKLGMKLFFKIVGKTFLAIAVVGIAILTTVYFIYNEKLPEANQSAEAEKLAQKMLTAVHHEAYLQTNYIEWTFAARNSYKWSKAQQLVEVTMGKTVVELNIQQPELSTVLVNGTQVEGASKTEAIESAIANFNNDSFWLVAPHKVFDSGTERGIVELENGEKALLVTYASGGTTPGDSYLWLLDESGLPTAFKMWVSIIPVGGIAATWESWETSESGALFPTSHKFLFLDINMGDVKASK